ncbi:hypothetical protein BGZ60DRAFT_409543 [Tricladium varicosporioides]|nr:hypothetical protein BGZ60DRAFT_409543 [Hymenoscyphus varicosporioides]
MSQISELFTNAPPELLAYFAQTPAIPPPDGVQTNFTNPETRALTQVITTSIILGFVLLFFLNRVYSKVFLMRKLTWDDATLLLGLLGSIAYYVACTWSVQRGKVGRHLWNINILQASSLDLQIPAWLISVLTPLTFLFLKPTFFILYLQIFNTIRWLRVCTWFGLVFTTVTYGVLTTCVFVFATPRKGESWLAHQTTKNEKRTLAMSVPQSIIGLVIDLYILMIPIIGIYGLRMSTKRKIGLMLIFLSGLMGCICSACSIYYRVKLEHTADVTWALIPVNIATLSEMFAGIICASMPSAAHVARQHNSTYQKLLRSLSTRFTSLKSTFFGSRFSTNSRGMNSQKTETYPEPEILKPEDVMKSTDRKYAQYFSLDDISVAGTRIGENKTTTTITGREAV